MLAVEYSELAQADFEALADRLSDYDARAALLLIDRIESAVERLKEFPELGTACGSFATDGSVP